MTERQANGELESGLEDYLFLFFFYCFLDIKLKTKIIACKLLKVKPIGQANCIHSFTSAISTIFNCSSRHSCYNTTLITLHMHAQGNE